jgi:hypothetical protein
MTTYDTHLCLVSAQATPNLLPLLDDAWRPKKVVLACSAQMKHAAQALRAVIQTKASGMVVETLELPNAYDYAALSDSFLSYLAEHESEHIALNVTGGTKLMAVAAQEAFRSAGKPVFYVNVESDEVLVIGEKSTGQAAQPLRAKLKVHEMLRAHGYSVTTQEHPQITRELRDLTARLVDRVSSAGRALGALNALARAARDNNLRVELNRDQSSMALGDVVALFADAGLLRQQGDTLIFKDEESRFFANGGWLEAHVYEALQSLRAQHDGLTDVAMGVRVAFGGQDPRSAGKAKDKNEIDVAFLYRNTLHLIECKTANLAQGGKGDDNKATEALYKMESLLKLGGLRTRGMVVDYRGQLASSEADRQRAKESHIEIVSGVQLKDLKGTIARLWLPARQT